MAYFLTPQPGSLQQSHHRSVRGMWPPCDQKVTVMAPVGIHMSKWGKVEEVEDQDLWHEAHQT